MARLMENVESAISGGGEEEEAEAPRFTQENAMQYLIQMKNTLGDETYDEFENIMKDKHYKRIGSLTAIEKAKELLEGHGEQLLLGFNQWIPERYRTPIRVSKQMMTKSQELDVEYGRARDYVQKIRTRFKNEDRVYATFCEIMNLSKRGVVSGQEVHQKVRHIFSQHADLLDEFKNFFPDNGPVISNETVIPPAAKPASPFEERTTISFGSHQEQEAFEAEKGKMDNSIHTEMGNKAASKDTADCSIFPNPSPEQVFFENVKQRLRNRDLHQEFLKCINLFSKEVITSSELQGLLVTIFGLDSDLMAALRDLLRSQENIDLGDRATSVKKPRVTKGKQQERKQNGRDHEEHTEHDQRKQKKRKRDSLADQKEAPGKMETSEVPDREFGEWEICTPGYRLVPKDFPKPSNIHCSKLGHEVLNVCCLSVPCAAMDSESSPRKNQHEVKLITCEEERCHLSVLLELTAATALKVKELVDSMQSATFKQDKSTVALDNHLSDINFGRIRKIYGKNGREVIDKIWKNPSITLPGVLSRLLKEQHKLSRRQVVMDKKWRQVQSANHSKALTSYLSPGVRKLVRRRFD